MNINDLLLEKNKIIENITEIEEQCEGSDNEKNANKIIKLNMKKAGLLSEKNNISLELDKIDKQLEDINKEINAISISGIDKVLKAIKKQRWYFFKNKPKIIMDKKTGILWPNLDYYNCGQEDNEPFSFWNKTNLDKIIGKLNIDGYKGWEIPSRNEFINMIDDKSFPFSIKITEVDKNGIGWRVKDNNVIDPIDGYNFIYSNFFIIPCNKSITTKEYEVDILNDSKIYSEEERVKLTLQLFVKNDLEPIFEDNKITELYKKIFIEKPILLEKLNELQDKIGKSQENISLSSSFDYNTLLIKYDVKSINNSIIKYYEAIKNWIDEIMELMRAFENAKSDVIRECNLIGLTFSKKYEENLNLSNKENELFKERHEYFKKSFEIGLNDVNFKLLSIKKQAEELEDKIEKINSGENSIKELGLLEKESRATFEFIAENTANIIKKALIRIESFERNREFASFAVKVCEEWTKDYRVFKTSKKEELKNISEEDSIEEEVWTGWFDDWNNLRFIIEEKFLPLIERGLKGEIITNKIKVSEDGRTINIIEKLLELLKEYKEKIDKFYIEERKGIYQKFAFQVGGDLQEKFETESELFKITSSFQEKLQEVIFSVDKVEDKMFLLEWINNLVDIQIDEIINFIKDKELSKISEEVLKDFLDLKRKNYEIFILDSKEYGEKLAKREKEYNSLMFKMRKELMK
ncbi:hypothetical protein G6Z15_08150 [Clostridium perfringens]|uniref:hypothetical protein n=2 Tax=Clostridium perfringens TaxID=1502 RepID=UPI0013E34C9B|nr:hypothetical protein [Clostridium perfringens]NGT57808.1 hypothetical protein [Clostridium perfringens]